MTNQWYDALKRMAGMTRAGDLQWTTDGGKWETSSLTPFVFKRADLYGLAYFAHYARKLIAAYEVEIGNTDEDGRPYTYRKVVIEFIDHRGVLELEWPIDMASGPIAWDLLSAIRQQVSGVSEFMTQLLEDPKTQKYKAEKE